MNVVTINHFAAKLPHTAYAIRCAVAYRHCSRLAYVGIVRIRTAATWIHEGVRCACLEETHATCRQPKCLGATFSDSSTCVALELCFRVDFIDSKCWAHAKRRNRSRTPCSAL